MPDLILRNVTLLRREPPFGSPPLPPSPPTDIVIDAGIIQSIAPAPDQTADTIIDCTGTVASPPFVESHVHLDSALVDAGQCNNLSGTLFEGIENWRKIKATRSVADILATARQALSLMARHGTLYVRTHADISDPAQRPLDALSALRAEAAPYATLQVVAFPQDGLLRHARQIDWLRDAISTGKADVVGGIPHYELTSELGTESLRALIAIAAEFGTPVDVHCDEIDDPQSRFVEQLAAEALLANPPADSGAEVPEPNVPGRQITASHTTAMGSYDNAYFNKLKSRLVESQINFVANPLINIVLQGRADTYPKRRGLTRVKELWQAGCNVSLGYDCLMDPWYALGTGNMLDAAHMAVHACQMIGREEINACYDMVTWNGAQTLGLGAGYDIAPGNAANLLILPAANKFDALRRRVTPRQVISRGKIIAHSHATTTAPNLPSITAVESFQRA